MSVALLVADSGPLIVLARLNLLALPRQIFGRVLVTSTVWDEVTRAPRLAEVAPMLACLRNRGIEVVSAPVIPSELTKDARLDEGELSTIALALQMHATVLIDERLARASARVPHMRRDESLSSLRSWSYRFVFLQGNQEKLPEVGQAVQRAVPNGHASGLWLQTHVRSLPHGRVPARRACPARSAHACAARVAQSARR